MTESETLQENDNKQQQYHQVVEQIAPAPLTEEEQLKQYLSSEENRNNALRLAGQIEKLMGKDWFNMPKFMRRSKEPSQIVAFQKLQLCRMFGLLEQKMGTFRDSKDNRMYPIFRITISNESKIKAYQSIIQYHQDQIKLFEAKIKQVQESQTSNEK